MAAATTRQRTGQQKRFRRNCRVLCVRGVKWAILSYAFTRIYVWLYGAHPVLVPRLGTTLAVLCVAGVGLFSGLAGLSALVEALTALWQRWVPRRWRIR